MSGDTTADEWWVQYGGVVDPKNGEIHFPVVVTTGYGWDFIHIRTGPEVRHMRGDDPA